MAGCGARAAGRADATHRRAHGASPQRSDLADPRRGLCAGSAGTRLDGRRTLNTVLPATVLGGYPESHGWLHTVDVVFGLALVAYSEEIVFRRCARQVFQIYLNDGYALVVVTSILFGAYHWWTGIGNIVEAVLIGILLMLFYRRSAALWPVVLAHYLTDIVDFGL